MSTKPLTVVGLLVLALLVAPAAWGAAAVNAFDLDMVRVWTPDALVPLQSNCGYGEHAKTTRRMRLWLNRASRNDPHASVHQGALACLEGDAAGAAEAWRQDSDRLPAALFAAVASFPQGKVLDTPFADEIGEYGYRLGLREEKEDKTLAEGWYSFSLAYAPSVKAADRLTRLYQIQGKDDLAERVWQRLAEVLPSSDPQHWQAVVRLAELRKDWAGVAVAYEREAGVAETDEAYSLWLRSGDTWNRVREYDRAEDAYRQALALKPGRIDAYLRMGHLSRYRGWYGEAELWYWRAEEVAPESYAPEYYLGIAAREQRRYEDALAHFDRALAVRPKDPGVLYYKAITLEALGRRGEATEALEQAILHHSRPPQSWQRLRDHWLRYPNPLDDPDQWWALGRTMERKRQWIQAAYLYREGARRAYPPDDYRLLTREGLMLRYSKEWDRAKEVYLGVIERYPGRMDGYIGLGELFRVRGKYNDAAVWFRQAQRVAPKSYVPSYYLGLVAYAQKRYNKAVGYFDASLALKANNAGVLYHKAVSLKAMGRREDAIQALKQAMGLYKSPPGSWRKLLEKWGKEGQ